MDFLKQQGINDARQIDRNIVEGYARYIAMQVDGEELEVSYSQNLLSTVNVVLETMRKDKAMALKPAQWVGQRSRISTTVLATLERSVLAAPIQQIQENGNQRVAIIAELAREFGLRFREASLLDTQQARQQVNRLGRLNIIHGTKGGRGKQVDRWVAVNPQNVCY